MIIPLIPGSGNYLEDQYDKQIEKEAMKPKIEEEDDE